MGGDLEDPRRGADTQALGQAGQDAHDELDGYVFAVEERAVRLQEVAPRRPCSGTGATGRHWDDRWPGDCPDRAIHGSHNRHADKSAWRCQSHGGAGSSWAWGQAVAEALELLLRSFAHTGHSG